METSNGLAADPFPTKKECPKRIVSLSVGTLEVYGITQKKRSTGSTG